VTGSRLAAGREPPLIIHIVFRFDTGGLENGIVNLVNHMPPSLCRHAVVALTEVVPAFARRIRREGVEFYALHKPPGHALTIYPALYRLLRQRRPHIVHTRNLAALECQAPAMLAGVPVRIHGEHGRDADDLDGTNRRYQRIRRLYRPFVQQYVSVSRDLTRYLVSRISVDPLRVTTICNGVDTRRFHPPTDATPAPSDWPFERPAHWVIGTVGRMQAVKNQTLLVRAFLRLLEQHPALRGRLRLAMCGDGSLRAQCMALLAASGASDLAWLPGERADIPELMRALDVFVLPSLGEGISNTILEAMACGLPVVATDVGGNAELVEPGRTGMLVPSGDVDALAAALLHLHDAAEQRREMGSNARRAAERCFSIGAMVAAYGELSAGLLARC
jgi:sugar transferase (PEP-CTERM/EpsH1 system associated)